MCAGLTDRRISVAHRSLTPKAFRTHEPLEQHGWLIKVTRARVLAETRNGAERIAFEAVELGFTAAR